MKEKEREDDELEHPGYSNQLMGIERKAVSGIVRKEIRQPSGRDCHSLESNQEQRQRLSRFGNQGLQKYCSRSI
jgi:hypothetical protein